VGDGLIAGIGVGMGVRAAAVLVRARRVFCGLNTSESMLIESAKQMNRKINSAANPVRRSGGIRGRSGEGGVKSLGAYTVSPETLLV